MYLISIFRNLDLQEEETKLEEESRKKFQLSPSTIACYLIDEEAGCKYICVCVIYTHTHTREVLESRHLYPQNVPVEAG